MTDLDREVKLLLKTVPGFKLLDDAGKKHVLGNLVKQLSATANIDKTEAERLLRDALGQYLPIAVDLE